ncbi:hypothetical protein JCGZ_11361 [Jatropha curcas]|uniref:Lysine-specific demethylase REF6 n=1 Tax=Jatropha curcas TaxID=180498 RepID=A0A067KFE5_JATCU|nr:hypothetical protein JCGZ_11361 [Jatropha curcas]
MAASAGLVSEPTSQQPEVFQWLKNLPLAPEYHPTPAEFQDPIAYIFKIEKEAAKYGICKIVPPVVAAPKKAAISNLNRSLAARAGSPNSKSPPTFTTRQQQIGFCPRKPRPVQKPVWQSGENYTFQEFETKAKSFEKSYLKKGSKKGALSPLEIETLYWKATVDKPFSVEYANDMPGSAFSHKKTGGKELGEGVTVGETEWNMRGVSRSKGSLLRFMKEEIPGVTSPMVYVAMLFSWFAWHVEDHDLHSLNYLHMGAGKTWYGVPREAAVAFEEVVRVHGYGGETNPLVTFQVLGEKTTVMSPEVFISAGVPCCRLVQNAGEFVVTFPRAYHSGFSHGFNCGEAANIATPEWLRVAKDAAIRRASINYPPMVSHFQLLYDLALELCTRVPDNNNAKPRSSRLKDKQRGEGETLVKEQFVKNALHNNDLLHILGKESSIVILPRSSSDISVCSNLRVGSQLRMSSSLGLCRSKGIMQSSKSSVPDEIMLQRNNGINQVKGLFSVKDKFSPLSERNRFSSLNGNDKAHTMDTGIENGFAVHGDKLSDQRLFSCVTCGILSFDCVAVIQPREAAARYLMSADCSFFNDWVVGSAVTNGGLSIAGGDTNTSEQNSSTIGLFERAAIRRASINYPPMVSHFQLLYDLALELCTRVPDNNNAKPRSSRLKDKQRGEGETLVKEQFVKNALHNNDLLHILGKESSIVILPRSSSDISVCSNLRVGSQLRMSSSLGLCRSKGIMQSSKSSVPDEIMLQRNNGINQVKGLFSVKDKFSPLSERNRFSSLNGNDKAHTMDTGIENGFAVHGDKLSDQRLFSCVTCGILSFDCVAVIQPREAAARYLMSADCSFFNDWVVGSAVTNGGLSIAGGDTNTSEQNSSTKLAEKNIVDGLYDVPVQSINYQIQIDQNKVASNAKTERDSSALHLLALNYGNSSDSEEDQVEPDVSDHADEINKTNCSLESKYHYRNSALSSFKQECHHGGTVSHNLSSSRLDCGDKVPPTVEGHVENGHGFRPANFEVRSDKTLDCSIEFETDNLASMEPNGLEHTFRDPISMPRRTSNCSPAVHDTEKAKFGRVAPRENTDTSFAQRSDEDSSRMHVFCLDHAVEVEQQFRPIGGVHILLLCHPEYRRIEAAARLVSEELGIDCVWNDITFRDATKEDEENIQSALDSEEAIPGNGDWAVKLGINLFYSANLSRSPLYSKQMPYNSVIYNAFGRSSPTSSPTKLNVYGRRTVKQRKVVAGRWCGKVWMSNQVHPFLAKRDSEDQDQEQEPERSFRCLTMPDEKLDRKPQYIHKIETTSAARKSGRKRKITAASGPLRKVRCPDIEGAASDDPEGDVSHKQQTRVYSRKQTMRIERDVSYNLLEDNSHQQPDRIHRSKQAKSFDGDNAVSDDSFMGNSHQHHKRILRSKQAKSIESENDVSYASVENNSKKQHSRNPRTRSKQVKYVERKNEISDDSLEAEVHEWHGRLPRSRMAKYFDREDTVSDNSLDESSHRTPGRAHRGQQGPYIDKEDAISDDSVENSSLQQNRGSFRGSHTKYIEREDEVSDDMLEESTYQQHAASHSRRAKFMDMEGEVSDELQEENTHQKCTRILRSNQAKFAGAGSDDSFEDSIQRQRVPRSRSTKFFEREDAVSDDSLEDDAHLKRKRIPRRKKAKFMRREDVSDHMQEDDAKWQPNKTPRFKQAKFIDREDVSDDLPEEDTYWQPRKTSQRKQTTHTERDDVSDDMGENNTCWQPSKTTRGKQAKFMEREDVVSDDLLEDNPNKQQSKILRSKQTKPVAVPKMKLETPRQLRQGTARPKRKENSQSIKRGKQMKQETPQLRNARQVESHFEEELDGGPSTRLRKRPSKPSKDPETKPKEKLQNNKKKVKNASAMKPLTSRKNVRNKDEDAEYHCDIEGCSMSFSSKQELALHKRNICPVKGCGKTFLSHKYLVQHRRVHLDDRPLKCPWKGCKMAFKWAWARTEHIRVHTGARPYVCAEEGCGQTFRFVSDFSRHKRKTGHSVKKSRG